MKQETRTMFDMNEEGTVGIRGPEGFGYILTFHKGELLAKPHLGKDGKLSFLELLRPSDQSFPGIVWCI